MVAALEEFADLPDWLAGVMAPDRVAEALRGVVADLPGERIEVTGAEVDRLRAKGDTWQVHCRVAVVRDGHPADLVLVGQLLPPGSQPPPDDVLVPFGDPGWSCYLADLGLHLSVEVADAALPALPSLVDADKAVEVLQRSLREAGHDVDVVGCEPDVVRYKPGSRCTIVYRMQYRDGLPGPDPLVAKTHQGDKGATAWEAMRALWAAPVARSGVVTLAEPLAYLPEERVLVQGPVPEERTLKDLARDALTDVLAGRSGSLDELREMLARTAVALAALHRSGAEYGRVATWGEELAEVRGVVARLATTVPRVGAAADPLLSRLEALHSSSPADSLASAHHDFRPAQVLLHGGGVGFIDFDGSCRAEPALDLGRFRAKLRDIGISVFSAADQSGVADPTLERHLGLLDELCDDFLAEYQRHAAVTPERVVLWESTDLLTALLHAWTKVRTARVGPRLAVLRHTLRTAPVFATG